MVKYDKSTKGEKKDILPKAKEVKEKKNDSNDVDKASLEEKKKNTAQQQEIKTKSVSNKGNKKDKNPSKKTSENKVKNEASFGATEKSNKNEEMKPIKDNITDGKIADTKKTDTKKTEDKKDQAQGKKELPKNTKKEAVNNNKKPEDPSKEKEPKKKDLNSEGSEKKEILDKTQDKVPVKKTASKEINKFKEKISQSVTALKKDETTKTKNEKNKKEEKTLPPVLVDKFDESTGEEKFAINLPNNKRLVLNKTPKTKQIADLTIEKKKNPESLDKKHKPKNSSLSKATPLWKRILKVAIVFILVVGCLGVGAVMTIYLQAPDINYDRFQYIEPSTIYDNTGKEYESLKGVENRESVEISEIPQIVQLAFISIEDQRFYSHNGVDLRGTLKAVLNVALKGNLEGPGGSTVTQQLLKLTHLSDTSSLKRKIFEWNMAPELESNLSKQQILEAYLNKVNMSQVWGVEAAAKYYFDKKAKDLSIAQAAVLASIVNAPTLYNPLVYETDSDGDVNIVSEKNSEGKTVLSYNENNKNRAMAVVDKMYDLGHISKAEHDISIDELENNKIGLTMEHNNTVYSYFTDAVYNQVLGDLQDELNLTSDEASDYLLNQGLKIYSTVDPVIQKTLEKKAATKSLFPSQSYIAKEASAAVTKKTKVKTSYIPQVAMTVVENKTGYVVGIVGGRDKKMNLSMNRALQYFQTGSSTKPLTVYAPGLDSGKVGINTIIDGNKKSYGGWVPLNSGGGGYGKCALKVGLKYSLNTVAVQTYLRVGWETILPYTEKLGLNIVKTGSATDINPAALALGGYTQGQTTLAMASAFTTFPNLGYRIEPTFYTKVVDKDGNIILEKKQEKITVWKKETALEINGILKQAVQGGTCYLSVDGQQMAGKTGTTDNERCAWFCGYTSRYAAAVWYGYDQNIVVVNGRVYTLNINQFGGEGPARFWQSCFRSFYAQKKIDDEKIASADVGYIGYSIEKKKKEPAKDTGTDAGGDSGGGTGGDSGGGTGGDGGGGTTTTP